LEVVLISLSRRLGDLLLPYIRPLNPQILGDFEEEIFYLSPPVFGDLGGQRKALQTLQSISWKCFQGVAILQRV
jgi:hypothetical protein